MIKIALAFVLSLLFSTAVISQVKVKNVLLDEEFSLSMTEMARVKSEAFEVKFKSVAEDSRCPPNANCVWAGVAKIKVALKKGNGPSREFELSTNYESQAIEFKGMKITLISLSDNPEWNSEGNTAPYKAEFMVEKL